MTYLVITPFFPLPGHWWGGYVYDQVKAIIDAKEFSRVVVLRTMPLGKAFDYRCEQIEVNGLPSFGMPSNILTGNKVQEKINNFLLKRTLKRLEIDINDIGYVHLHTFNCAQYGEIIKKWNPCATVFIQHHDLNPYGIAYGRCSEKKWQICYIAKKMISYYRYIDCHICISEACRDNLTLFPKVRPGEYYKDYISKIQQYDGPLPVIKNTYVLYNGVSTELFYKKGHPTNDVFTIGCIGGFTQIKNQITLIKAIERIVNLGNEDIALKFIGTGEQEEFCRNYILEHGLSKYIKFETGRAHKELCDFYNSLDLFCLPSYFEGFGCVFAEAYACGVPFMTCRYQGVEDLISKDQKNIFMIEDPIDWIELAELILKYKNKRPIQNLVSSIDISILIKNFLTWCKKNYPYNR